MYDKRTIEVGCLVSRQITNELTRITREGIARGETPPLLGALTAADLVGWIRNSRTKRHRQHRVTGTEE